MGNVSRAPALLCLIVAAGIWLCGCSKTSCIRPGDVVRSKDRALSLARSKLGDALPADRKLETDCDEGTWVVQEEWRSGDATAEAIMIDARSGRVTRDSTKTETVLLNRR